MNFHCLALQNFKKFIWSHLVEMLKADLCKDSYRKVHNWFCSFKGTIWMTTLLKFMKRKKWSLVTSVGTKVPMKEAWKHTLKQSTKIKFYIHVKFVRSTLQIAYLIWRYILIVFMKEKSHSIVISVKSHFLKRKLWKIIKLLFMKIKATQMFNFWYEIFRKI